MLTDPLPFKKLLVMVLAWALAYGGVQAFTTVYLKSAAGMNEGHVLFVTSIYFAGGLCSLWFLSPATAMRAASPLNSLACAAVHTVAA